MSFDIIKRSESLACTSPSHVTSGATDAVVYASRAAAVTNIRAPVDIAQLDTHNWRVTANQSKWWLYRPLPSLSVIDFTTTDGTALSATLNVSIPPPFVAATAQILSDLFKVTIRVDTSKTGEPGPDEALQVRMYSNGSWVYTVTIQSSSWGPSYQESGYAQWATLWLTQAYTGTITSADLINDGSMITPLTLI